MAKKQTPETALKRGVVKLLKIHGIPTWALVAGMGSIPGMPDRIGILPGGLFLALEFKRPEGISASGRKIPQGELTDHQTAVKKEIEAAGGKYLVVRRYEDVIEGLELPGRLF